MWSLIRLTKHPLRKFLNRSIQTKSTLSNLIDIHPTVREALNKRKPVVALESTIITHGMPHPYNFETALECEDIIRKEGSTPATIAIIDGRIKIGLTIDELKRLSNLSNDKTAIKCSRRDLAYVLSKRNLLGGTTVAGTLIIANMVGIKVFATGGIGGVHRNGHISFDISADLIELGRTPIAVISSGIKSILDIPRTLEYLETQGVCVASYQSDNNYFPAFYTRSSDNIQVPYNLKSSKEAAELIYSNNELNLKSGILIGVPIPEKYAFDEKPINEAIRNALESAEKNNIKGKSVTPFLLEAVSKITQGKSLESNMALIKNNARVASQIAREYVKISNSKHTDEDDYELCLEKNRLVFENSEKFKIKNVSRNLKTVPVVIGASILDVCLTVFDDEHDLKLDGATYKIKSRMSGGGVGRNIADGLFKLHGDVSFITAIGNDEMGDNLLGHIPNGKHQQKNAIIIDRKNSTSICTVIFDKFGDCKIIFGDMEIHKSITSEWIIKNELMIRNAPIVIIDCNIPMDTMGTVLELSQKYNKPVFYEPTDMRIAGKPFENLPRNLTEQIKFISPNLLELNEIAKSINNDNNMMENFENHNNDDLLRISKELLDSIDQYFDCVVLTLGSIGVIIANKLNHDNFFNQNFQYIPTSSRKSQYHYYRVTKIDKFVNVSGAGDSFTSGFITAMLEGQPENVCVSFGFNAAKCALQSDSAVPGYYFKDPEEKFQWYQNENYIEFN